MLQFIDEKNSAQFQSSIVSTPCYLISPQKIPNFHEISEEEFKNGKTEAIIKLNEDIEAARGNVEAIYQLFLQVKNTQEGMLRYRREHILPNQYGDTQSYGLAIKNIFKGLFVSYALEQEDIFPDEYDQVIDPKDIKLKSYNEYALISEILREVKRCGYYIQEYIGLIKIYKKSALQLFINEIEQQTTIAGVLQYYALLQIPQNILRIHIENLFHAEGDTNSYKAALCTIAKKAISLGKFDPVKERPLLKQLYDELHTKQPYFDTEWKKLADAFLAYLNTQATTIVNSVSSQRERYNKSLVS